MKSKETIELQNKMWEKLERTIEKLWAGKKINLVQYTIARDVLYDCTVDNSEITEDNNIAQELIDNQEKFMKDLYAGYLDMKEQFHDIDNWSSDEINEYSADFRDYVY